MNPDTSLGGRVGRFPSTSSSLVAEAAGGRLDRHLDAVARRYWRPVYIHVRRGWSKTNEEAKDLTQDFFAYLLEHETLSRFDPARGNFRTFLKSCLRNFLAADRRDAARLKRGGGGTFVSADAWKEVLAESLADDRATPEEAFESAWTKAILGRAVEELERRLRARDRAVIFEVFRRHDLAEGGDPPSYAEIAGSLGISVSDVTNHLRRARLDLRAILETCVAEYVAGEEEILAEEDRLLGNGP